MRSKHQNAFVPYTDLISVLFMWAISLVCLLIISVNFSIHTKGDVIPKAEYLITMTWDKTRDVDLDMWLRGPNDEIVMYTQKEAVNMSLDRDSRGMQTNDTVLPDGTHATSANEEIITLRTIIPGDYDLAVSYYGGSDNNGYSYQSGDSMPSVKISAQLQINKVNPKFTLVAGKTIELTKVKQSLNIWRFHIDADGKLTQLDLPDEDMIQTMAAGHKRP